MIDLSSGICTVILKILVPIHVSRDRHMFATDLFYNGAQNRLSFADGSLSRADRLWWGDLNWRVSSKFKRPLPQDKAFSRLANEWRRMRVKLPGERSSEFTASRDGFVFIICHVTAFRSSGSALIQHDFSVPEISIITFSDNGSCDHKELTQWSAPRGVHTILMKAWIDRCSLLALTIRN